MSTRVLVVDDEKDVRDAWARALRIAGYTVHVAGSPADALGLAESHAFDVVVLDFIIPGMDGVELLVRLRDRLPYIRSVVVSGKLDAGRPQSEITADLRISVEADVYLHKPCSNQQLIDVIEEFTSKEDASTWKDIADQTVRASKPKVKDAKTTARRLKQAAKKR
jgi:CheY-like chemotaxis protein